MAAIINGKRKDDDDDDVETRSGIDDLNDTLLELIFTRLILWRFLAVSKCVSKRWNSIISNPDFTRLLPPQSYTFTLILSKGNCIATEHPYFQKCNFPLHFIPGFQRLVANTNELVVAYHHRIWRQGVFYVTNPLTKQYVVVPIPFEPCFRGCWDYMVGIAGFVDGVSTLNVSHRNNRNHGFRIVQIIIDGNPKSTAIIYSSETGQWKTYLIDCFDYFDSDPSGLRQAVTWKNKIHWMKDSKIVVIDPFDIDNVAPRVLNLPTGIGNFYGVLGVCQNQLRVAQFEETISNGKYQRIKIWEIEDYNDINDSGTNSMAKVRLVIDFKLKRSLVERVYTGVNKYDPEGCHKMVCCHPNDPHVVYFSYEDRLFYCNVVENKCRELGYFSSSDWIDAFALVHPPLLYDT